MHNFCSQTKGNEISLYNTLRIQLQFLLRTRVVVKKIALKARAQNYTAFNLIWKVPCVLAFRRAPSLAIARLSRLARRALPVVWPRPLLVVVKLASTICVPNVAAIAAFPKLIQTTALASIVSTAVLPNGSCCHMSAAVGAMAVG